jgi:phospholipase C
LFLSNIPQQLRLSQETQMIRNHPISFNKPKQWNKTLQVAEHHIPDDYTVIFTVVKI